MSVSVEKLENSMAKLTIEVPAEELDKAIERAYQKQKSQISIPGFRKGKVPRQMVEKMYGPEVFFEDAANDLIGSSYEQAMEECGEDIVSAPSVDVVQIERGKAFIYTAEVALKPPVKLGKYKGISIEKQDVEVTEEDINAEIDRERERNGRTVEVTDRAVMDKDQVTLDFEGFVDGVAFEGGKGENYDLTIGSGAFIPGFEEQLIGAKIDEEVEVNVTFPEEYQATELQGKPAVFKCTVHAIKAKELPELNDEYVSDISEFENVADYKADVKKNLEERKASAAKSAKQEAALDALVEASEMELPEAMVLTEQRQMVNEFAQQIQMQGLSMEQYMQYTGGSIDRLVEQVKPQAEKRIKQRLVLEAVAEAEKFEITEQDVEDELKRIAEIYGMDVESVKDRFGEKEIAEVKKDLAIQKASDYIVDNAKEKK